MCTIIGEREQPWDGHLFVGIMYYYIITNQWNLKRINDHGTRIFQPVTLSLQDQSIKNDITKQSTYIRLHSYTQCKIPIWTEQKKMNSTP